MCLFVYFYFIYSFIVVCYSRYLLLAVFMLNCCFDGIYFFYYSSYFCSIRSWCAINSTRLSIDWFIICSQLSSRRVGDGKNVKLTVNNWMMQERHSAKAARRSARARCCGCRTNTSTQAASSAACATTLWRREDSSARTAAITVPKTTSSCSEPNAPPASGLSRARLSPPSERPTTALASLALVAGYYYPSSWL